MAQSSIEAVSGDVWFVDWGCSNHISGTRSLLKEVDQSQKSDVMLPNGASINIEGQGTVAVNSSDSSVQHIYDLQYIPCLTYNPLSVCQLMENGYSVVFYDNYCIVHDKKDGTKNFWCSND